MAEIAREVRRSRHLVLATDPDREGEAISWHLLQELQVGRTGGREGCLAMALLQLGERHQAGQMGLLLRNQQETGRVLERQW